MRNPIAYIDYNGENPLIAIGAAAGFVKEVVSQTISNGIENKNSNNGFFDGWAKKMDWADVAISTGEGAIAGATGGASLFLSGAAMAARSGIDWKGGETWKVVGVKGEHGKHTNEAIMDVIGEAVGYGIGDMLGVNKLTDDVLENFDLLNNIGLASFLGSLDGVFSWGLDQGKDLLKGLEVEPSDLMSKLGYVNSSDVNFREDGSYEVKDDALYNLVKSLDEVVIKGNK